MLNAGKGFDIETEDELDAAFQEAFENRESYSILDVHIDPHDFSRGLKRLTEALRERVKE